MYNLKITSKKQATEIKITMERHLYFISQKVQNAQKLLITDEINTFVRMFTRKVSAIFHYV